MWEKYELMIGISRSAESFCFVLFARVEQESKVLESVCLYVMRDKNLCMHLVRIIILARVSSIDEKIFLRSF